MASSWSTSRQIARLLLAGLTDQAVATQLHLSLRTVQRRLRHLRDLPDVRSRLQPGGPPPSTPGPEGLHELPMP